MMDNMGIRKGLKITIEVILSQDVDTGEFINELTCMIADEFDAGSVRVELEEEHNNVYLDDTGETPQA